MRLGIFGGSFDPVHYAHLLAAECCREQAQLDEVWFVPASVPPHKTDRTLSTAEHREQMLRLAIGGEPEFHLSKLEIERGGVSYTVDTLEAVHVQRPEAELFLILGGDSLVEFPTWRAPQRIRELAKLLIVARPGAGPIDDPDVQRIEMPQIDISATELRMRVGRELSIRYRTPRAVELYIGTHGLYREIAAP